MRCVERDARLDTLPNSRMRTKSWSSLASLLNDGKMSFGAFAGSSLAQGRRGWRRLHATIGIVLVSASGRLQLPLGLVGEAGAMGAASRRRLWRMTRRACVSPSARRQR